MFVADISYYMGSINHPEMLTESQKENSAIVATRKIVWTWKWYDKIAYHFKQIAY